MEEKLSISDKIRATYRVSLFRPVLTLGIIGLSLFAAILEGIGLSFLLPIIELSRNENAAQSAEGMIEVFVTIYNVVGIPFTLEFIVSGVATIMIARYLSSFLVAWMAALLRQRYVEYLQTAAFGEALDAEISYFDQQGSDEILNTIVTQANYAGRVIFNLVRLVEQGLLSLMYLAISLYLAPILTLVAGIVLGGITFILRNVLESGYSVGDRIASANERVQEAVQAGTQGIRDVKLFGMRDELFEDFRTAVDQSVSSQILLRRNQAALTNFYQLGTAVTVFVIIYAAVKIASMSIAGLGVFLFAMFRLAPRVSTVNDTLYKIEGNLPHLVRTQEFIDELADRGELNGSSEITPREIETITLDNISFAYDTGEQIFDGLSLSFETGEFVAFVGPSGAGKSTIVSLLTRMYEPDAGEIRVDGNSIDNFDIREWRSRISVVRQNPFIFNDTLRRNITIADRDASHEEIKRVSEIAQVTEYLDELPDGYDTVLGDEGVRLSGGQKQRVALARALLKDAELLVLDEATSDLDTNIEEVVHQAIESMERDYAMLVIAHRLSTVVNADRIYIIEDGEVVESGVHNELINKDGTYASLYRAQTRTT